MSSLMTDVIERHEVSWRSSSLYEVGKFCGDFLGLLGISPTSILQLTSGALAPCDVWVPIKTAYYDGRWRLERTPFGSWTLPCSLTQRHSVRSAPPISPLPAPSTGRTGTAKARKRASSTPRRKSGSATRTNSMVEEWMSLNSAGNCCHGGSCGCGDKERARSYENTLLKMASPSRRSPNRSSSKG